MILTSGCRTNICNYFIHVNSPNGQLFNVLGLACVRHRRCICRMAESRLPELFQCSTPHCPNQATESVCRTPFLLCYIVDIFRKAAKILKHRILKNNHTGKPVHYYEIEIKPLEQQVYPGLPRTRLVGYDGISPGPTFMMEQGTEAIVRFINHGDRANSVHLHGSYSRAPFDGWAEDTTEVGQYKDYYYPNSQVARTLWYHVRLLNP